MNNSKQKSAVSTTTEKTVSQPVQLVSEMPDDRYPGTFFRIPGVPIPGKTTWSLAK